MDGNDASTKFVDFRKYCPICKWGDKSPTADPCNECLETGGRAGTEKPTMFEEDE